jgi:hypothetical protein
MPYFLAYCLTCAPSKRKKARSLVYECDNNLTEYEIKLQGRGQKYNKAKNNRCPKSHKVDFLALSFSYVGLTLALDKRYVLSRKNKQAAKALKIALFFNQKGSICDFVFWLRGSFESRKNKSPHIYALLFVPIRDLAQAVQKYKSI